jgi:AcrR family transcriptional regulator
MELEDMPPKVKYTMSDVLRAAVSIVEEHGLKQLTARNVAEKLGSSTAPVYRHFATMNELALEVIRDIQKQLLEYTSRPYTDRIFLNMGTGTAMFACEHSKLYKALLLEENSYGDVVQEFLEILDSELTKDKRFTSLSDGERRQLLRKMWTFTHGLASLICVGLIKECNQEYIINTLADVGTDVIKATLARHDDNHAQKE